MSHIVRLIRALPMRVALLLILLAANDLLPNALPAGFNPTAALQT